MSAIIKGLGCVWSVGVVSVTAGITASAQGTGHLLQSLGFERGGERALVKDNGGTNRIAIYHGGMQRLSLNVVPTGTTVANARTSAENWLPAQGTAITFTDDSGTLIDASAGGGAGIWNCDSAKLGRTVDGVATIDLELSRSDESVDITTVIA